MAGLTPTGFDKKTADDCLQEMKLDLWSSISKGLNLAVAVPLGQLLRRLSVREGALWDALEAIHAARDPDQASGAALRAVSKLTGTKAQAKSKTLVKGCVVNVNSGFNALAGTMVATLDTDPTKLFENVDAVSNPGGAAADVTADFIARDPGAVPVPAGHLVVISTTLSGWNSVTNPTDGEVGLDDDTDPTLRERRAEELQNSGSSTADAIRSDILKFLASNVSHCKVDANDSDAVSATGVPAHAFEVIARGQATDDNASIALARQILKSKDAGDTAVGTASKVVQDDQGNDHVIGYTWVQDATVYLTLTVKVDPKTFPADGDTQLKNAIVALNSKMNPGDSVVAEFVKAQSWKVVGVTDVLDLALDTVPAPTNTANLPIDRRKQAVFDTGRIVVVHG